MPVRYPILNGMGRLGLVDVAAKMIDASVDTIVKEQGEAQAQELKEQFERLQMEERAKRENMPPKLPDIKMPQPAVYDVPHVKGGRYHEPPRDLKKKKKAKRRQQKQSRRKR